MQKFVRHRRKGAGQDKGTTMSKPTPHSWRRAGHALRREVPHWVLLALLALPLLLQGCGLFNFGSSQPSASNASRNKVVTTAYSQMGKAYRLGGASPAKGFDCSGLLYWAYRKNGVNVPRVSHEQARAGTGVSPSRARPGDIVVFRTGARNLHTGMYIGNNSFIHSPSSGGRVRIESMDVNYWKKRLVAVRSVMR